MSINSKGQQALRTADKIWADCLNLIRDNVTPEVYSTWFIPIVPVRLEGATLTLRLPSETFKDYLENHCLDLLHKALRRYLGDECSLYYDIVSDTRDAKNPCTRSAVLEPQQYAFSQKVNLQTPPEYSHTMNPFVVPGVRQITIDPQLNPQFTFDNFVIGDCNRAACMATQEVAKTANVVTAMNPLILYGKTGLGKSHLANAIGLAVRERFPEKIVLYVRTEQFMNQYLRAVQNNQVTDFLVFYQNVDLLIVDDVHDFSERKGTQNVFFQLYNHLHQNNNQLIFTSDRPPVDLKGIRSDLLSRFKWGISVELQAPDYETRLAILKRKALINGGDVLGEEVLEYVAENVTSDVRELEGVINSITMHSVLDKTPITLDFARHVLRDLIVPKHNQEISLSEIQGIVSKYYSLTIPELVSNTRKREIVRARQVAMFLSKRHTKHSVAYIGEHTGSKNHATVIHSCRVVEDEMEVNREFARQVDELDRQVRMRS